MDASYLDAGVGGLRLGLNADVRPAVVLPLPTIRVVARVSVLVGDNGRYGLSRISLDEEPVQSGRGALGDGSGLVGGVRFIRVSAVNHPALRDVDTGGAAHASLEREPEPTRPITTPGTLVLLLCSTAAPVSAPHTAESTSRCEWLAPKAPLLGPVCSRDHIQTRWMVEANLLHLHSWLYRPHASVSE